MVSIRQNNLPLGIIFPYFTSGTLPSGFSYECSYFSKYLKGAPACTNPGSSVGSNTHTESAAAACHSHTAANVSHSHSFGSNGDTQSSSYGGSTNGIPTWPGHTHPGGTTGSTSSAVSIGSEAVAHCHGGATSNEPSNRIIRYIKYTRTSVALRQKNLPTNILSYTNSSTIQNNWALETTMVGNNFHKGVVSACSTIGCVTGSATHQHSADSGHTHTTTMASHSHTITAFGIGGGGAGYAPGTSSNPTALAAHSHGLGCVAVTAGSPTISFSTNTHQHDSVNNEPEYIELKVAKKNNLNLRQNGLFKNSISIWSGTLANIPATFQLADGTNGTPDTVSKYIREVTNACSVTSTTGGATTHTHPTATHAHTGTSDHSHASTGRSSVVGGAMVYGGSINYMILSGTHSHSAYICNSAATALSCNSTSGSHSPGSSSNIPETIEVAFIVKVL